MPKAQVITQIEPSEDARLIPVSAATQREAAAVSALLAVFRIVPSFARLLLGEAGAPISLRSNLTCLTEVVFKVPKHHRNQLPRPDGLIIVDTGRRQWTALIEAKIKNEQLKAQQLEQYLDIAKEKGIDAVITISNQFAPIPEHHPVSVDRRKLKSVGLYHFSWISILSSAQLLSDSSGIDDREQAMVLQELIRFLKHEKSGVKPFDRMSSSWAELCSRVHNKEPLVKTDPTLEAVITDWYQLCKYLSLSLSTSIGKRVSVAIRGKHKKDASLRLEAHKKRLISTNCLSEVFEIPNAAGDIVLEVDMARRTVSLSMEVSPPQDVQRPTACINWLTRQLKKHGPKDVRIGCRWPRKTPNTSIALEDALDDPKDLVPEGIKDLPVTLEVKRVKDTAGRFRGAKTIIEDIETVFSGFYKDIGQHLSPWIPPPPKYKDRIAQGGIEQGGKAAESKADEIPSSNPFSSSSQ